MIVTHRELKAGVVVSPWYGIAYRRPNKMEVCFLPIPINLIVRQWIVVLDWIRMTKPTLRERIVHEAYVKGFMDGTREADKIIKAVMKIHDP